MKLLDKDGPADFGQPFSGHAHLRHPELLGGNTDDGFSWSSLWSCHKFGDVRNFQKDPKYRPMVITPKYWGRSTPGSGKHIYFPMGLYGDIEKIYVKLTIVTSLKGIKQSRSCPGKVWLMYDDVCDHWCTCGEAVNWMLDWWNVGHGCPPQFLGCSCIRVFTSTLNFNAWNVHW